MLLPSNVLTGPVGRVLREVSGKTSSGFMIRLRGDSGSFFRLSRGNSGMIVQNGACVGVTAKVG